MKVCINATGYNDQVFTNSIFTKGAEINVETIALDTEILKLVDEKIGQ